MGVQFFECDPDPVLLDRMVDAVIRAGLFPNREALYREAIEALFAARPELHVEAAIEMFRNDEVSFLRAAEIARTDFETFRKLLLARGIPRVIEPESVEDMDRQIADIVGSPKSSADLTKEPSS